MVENDALGGVVRALHLSAAKLPCLPLSNMFLMLFVVDPKITFLGRFFFAVKK
jgi:hypothetical protein